MKSEPVPLAAATSPDAILELAAYFARVGYAGGSLPTAATLCDLHRAHAMTVPFENLEVLLGRPIRLDLASLQEKLVRDRRGGYCFEQNALFAAVLERLGFRVTRLAARVRSGTAALLPRTHMALMVEADGESWLADVGFGGWGLLEAIPLVANRDFTQGLWTFRLRHDGDAWVLQCPQCPSGPDQYGFTLEPQMPVDYEPANYYCSTHPESRFVRTLTAQLPSPTDRRILRDRELVVFDENGLRTEHLESDEALVRVLAESFGLHLPAGSRFAPTRSAS